MNLNGFLSTTSGRTKLCYGDWACLQARRGACSHPQYLAPQGQSGSTNSSAEWNVPDHRAASAYCHTPWSPECLCWPQRVHRNAPDLRSGSWFLAQHYLQLCTPLPLSTQPVWEKSRGCSHPSGAFWGGCTGHPRATSVLSGQFGNRVNSDAYKRDPTTCVCLSFPPTLSPPGCPSPI